MRLSASRHAVKIRMQKSVLLQLSATIVAAIIASALFGPGGALSAGLAGLACVIPTWLFALKLGAMARRRTVTVTAFVVGELIKVSSIVGLLMLTLLVYPNVHWGALLIGIVLTLKANLFAFLIKN